MSNCEAKDKDMLTRIWNKWRYPTDKMRDDDEDPRNDYHYQRELREDMKEHEKETSNE